MPEVKQTTQQILENTNSIMKTAELGYSLLTKDSPKNRLSGLMNLVVFGRAVTSALQKLRGIEPTFDEWYKRYVDQMREDPLLKYFYNLRSTILKEGIVRVGSHVHIKHLNNSDFARIPPPPSFVKVESFFMGDNLGGCGYQVLLPDGNTEKYYVDIPTEIVKVNLVFPDAPKLHLGKIVEPSVESMSRLYLDYLQKMVVDANSRFNDRSK